MEKFNMEEFTENGMKLYTTLLELVKDGKVGNKNMILVVDILEKVISPKHFKNLIEGTLSHDDYLQLMMENCAKLYRMKSDDNVENLILLASIISDKYEKPKTHIYTEFLKKRSAVVPIVKNALLVDVEIDSLNIFELYDKLYDSIEKSVDFQDESRTLEEIWDKEVAPIMVDFAKTVCEVLLQRSICNKWEK